VGCVSVPPGVLASSRVGVSGAAIEFESLLGNVCDCARRCLMLSIDDKGLVGDCFVVGLVNRVKVEWEGSVGVGGVTRVVGVSVRPPGGVSGSDDPVLILPLRGVSFGVPACPSLGRTAAEGGVSGAVTVSADGRGAETAETESAGFAWTEDCSCGCSVTGSCEVTLLLLLRGLNSPPIPPRTFDSPTPDAVDSLDFLRLRANPALSLSAGDGLALRMRLRLAEPFVEGEVLSKGSTICGSDDVELFVERLVVESPVTTCEMSGADCLCVD
jgi:hypothetical protein